MQSEGCGEQRDTGKDPPAPQGAGQKGYSHPEPLSQVAADPQTSLILTKADQAALTPVGGQAG